MDANRPLYLEYNIDFIDVVAEYNLYVGAKSIEITEIFVWHGTYKNAKYQVERKPGFSG